MRKVIKVFGLILIFAVFFSKTELVMAGSINEYEAELIAIGEGTFYYNNKEYVATEAAKLKVYNYLMQNDVNLSASQAAEAKDTFWGNIAKGIEDGYLVCVTPPETDDGGNTSGGTTSGGFIDTPAEDTTVVYTYTEMKTTMYAKQAVNVRNLPGTNGARVGSLSANQEITVTGQCVETGWYRIIYNGTEAYVSNNYLTDTAIEEETEVVTEIETETQNSEIEQATEDANVAETETSTETEASTDTEISAGTEETSEVETETEVVLREKHFNKGLNMATVAMIIGGIALVAGIIVVVSHKNRRY
ncbi:MAG: SH3 domain-containing protein [Lachnospiraceae bacterium]|nr:SH3 domain-containing protein [Lachnospiraceae bacterium]